jgi:hypothetical protein
MAKRLYNNGEERKPAVTVKCKYCEWKGSSRGLFTHVRLAHPGISKKPESTKKYEYHPLDVNVQKRPQIDIYNKYEKSKKHIPSTEEQILTICLKALTMYFERQNTLERGNKPNLFSPNNI